ncbi:BZ3500_MvSof-1268-A1-R1_Chr11-1g03273 [Microbotryum saponariae]|uniref:BZ3500_MvSof-1268-A1-R1_Chr11-1g03273 protein n=1 Tax=Microbotryum saponariae TaxID=289078 RepID=A0A2X0L8A7_9BASI|nr:BZ3501_MvSof-1269-A2-R1_Chr11g02848 [Microbotryum saponariae]SDA03860.1 BZ3500_MvSof-1268-A1-R1_Chr11-1g03273 [Microbotryum saponariae]
MTAASVPVPQQQYDVVIVGAGPAGLMAALCLTTYGFQVLHIDDRPEPTTAGRADGLQPRTIEVLRNIGSVKGKTVGMAGLAKRMIADGVRVYEVAFWDPTETEQLARTSRAPSCPEFIDVVDNYTLLLHQGLIENAFLDEIENRRAHLPSDKFVPAPHGGCFRPYLFETCSTDLEANPEYPVSCTLSHADTKEKYTVRAKYLFGNDGAKSLVRRAISGSKVGDGEWQGKIRMLGDASEFIWGVMDVEVKTDFPDIMSKCLIHSRDAGSIMVIPRENGLVRLYVQLQEEGTGKHYERNAATEDICKARAAKIFEPYKIEWGRIDWFSVYQIGQRIASAYTLDERIFLGGDATHTHSPKAGQGMNISILDMYSLSWRINLVEKGMADRKILLPTYEIERRGVAEELLAFDRAYAALFSGKSPKSDQLTADATKAKAKGAVDAELFIETFKKHAFFTSGCGAVYGSNSILNALPDSPLVQNYAKKGVFNPEGTKLIAGRRLLPGKLTRAVDANQVRIQQEVKMNGAFRIIVMAGQYEASKASLKAFDEFLSSSSSFWNVHRPKQGVQAAQFYNSYNSRNIETETRDPNFNPFFTFVTVLADPHTEWDIEALPFNLRVYRSQIYSDDIFDKRVLEAGSNAPLHAKYGVDVKKGSIVAVRPDGYVGAITSLDADGFEALNAYFKSFLI